MECRCKNSQYQARVTNSILNGIGGLVPRILFESLVGQDAQEGQHK
jgi:hypothetical protein